MAEVLVPLVGAVLVLVGLALLVMAAGGLAAGGRDEFGRPGVASPMPGRDRSRSSGEARDAAE